MMLGLRPIMIPDYSSIAEYRVNSPRIYGVYDCKYRDHMQNTISGTGYSEIRHGRLPDYKIPDYTRQ